MKKITNLLMSLLLVALIINIVLIGKLLAIMSDQDVNNDAQSTIANKILDTPITSEEASTINNSEYENISEIQIYIDAKMTDSRYYPSGGCFGGYNIYFEEKTNTMRFQYYTYNSEGNYDEIVQADFSADVFYEIKNLIFENQIMPYNFKTDVNGKRIDSIEPYFITIAERNHAGIGIETPQNLDLIIAKLEEIKKNAQ